MLIPGHRGARHGAINSLCLQCEVQSSASHSNPWGGGRCAGARDIDRGAVQQLGFTGRSGGSRKPPYGTMAATQADRGVSLGSC